MADPTLLARLHSQLATPELKAVLAEDPRLASLVEKTLRRARELVEQRRVLEAQVWLAGITAIVERCRRERLRKGYDETELQEALGKCRRAAREGYRIARDNLDGIKGDIDKVSESLEQHLTSLSNGKVQTTDIESQTQKQLQQMMSDFYSQHGKWLTELKKKNAQLDKFSIALFGRTMSGKSTLMEILTNGDGVSIGKGSQRTTRDVRSYEWKGLKITDVPGIAAFEGREEEDLAFEAAKQSDLVFYSSLWSNDEWQVNLDGDFD